jgi:hypothetical protein
MTIETHPHIPDTYTSEFDWKNLIDTSGQLSEQGVDHTILYANTNWWLATMNTDPGKDRSLLVARNFLTRPIVDITDHVALDMKNRPAGRLDIIGQLRANLEAVPDRQQNLVIDMGSIALHEGVPLQIIDSFTPETEKAARNSSSRWIASMYTPETGRDTLLHFAGFRNALAAGSLALAASEICTLEGRVPENDCRRGHEEIRHLITRMCQQQGEPARGLATLAADAYCDSMRTGDPRVEVLRGALYHSIARETGNIAAARQAEKSSAIASRGTQLDGFPRKMYRRLAAEASRRAKVSQLVTA